MRALLLTLVLLFVGCHRTGAPAGWVAPEPGPTVEIDDSRMPSSLALGPMRLWDAGPGGDASGVCGDAVIGAGEECDLGPAPATECPLGVVSCALCVDCAVVEVAAPACGNGVLDAGEACDDANTAAGDGCFACARE